MNDLAIVQIIYDFFFPQSPLFSSSLLSKFLYFLICLLVPHNFTLRIVHFFVRKTQKVQTTLFFITHMIRAFKFCRKKHKPQSESITLCNLFRPQRLFQETPHCSTLLMERLRFNLVLWSKVFGKHFQLGF